MKNKTKSALLILALLLSFSVIFGCKVKTYSVVRERPDRETYGNQGFLTGQSDEPITIEKKTRKTYVVEIESAKPKVKAKKDVVLEMETEIEDDYSMQEDVGLDYFDEAQAIEESSSSVLERTYVVKKGDTLQKISLKFYGTSRRWNKIFKANKDRLKNSDKILPGQVLIIP